MLLSGYFISQSIISSTLKWIWNAFICPTKKEKYRYYDHPKSDETKEKSDNYFRFMIIIIIQPSNNPVK